MFVIGPPIKFDAAAGQGCRKLLEYIECCIDFGKPMLVQVGGSFSAAAMRNDTFLVAI